MEILQDPGKAFLKITPEEVHVQGTEQPARYDNEGALKLVVQDMGLAENWLGEKNWALHWRQTDILYQAPVLPDEFDNRTPRAKVPRFTVAKHVNAIVPTMMSGCFFSSPPFQQRPRPGTSEDTTRAWTALLEALLDEMDFKTEVENGMESQATFGTGFWKFGWETRKEIVKRRVRVKQRPTVTMPITGQQVPITTRESSEFVTREETVTINRPFFEHVPLGEVFLSPGWNKPNQPWKSRFIIQRKYVTFEDLNNLRALDGYTIPAEDELKELFFSPGEIAQAPSTTEQNAGSATVAHAARRDEDQSRDPLAGPVLELLERWDGGRVMVVLQRKLVLRNERHSFRKIPFLSANWWNIPRSGYGLGIGRLVGADQRIETGSLGAALDILAYSANPQWARSRGANVPTQQIQQRLGGIVDVDGDVDKAFRIIELPKVPAELWAMIANAKQSSESASGADEAFMQGSLPGRGGSSVGRTATGAGGLQAASAGRLQGPLGRFVVNVLMPFLDALEDMVKENMPTLEIEQIVGQQLGQSIELDMDDFLNAELKREVLAGAQLAAKKAMQQFLPIMVQIFENPHLVEQLNAQGYTVDVKEIFEMFMEVSEWRNSRQLIRPMTDPEKQAMQAQNPTLIKAQTTSQQAAQKLEGDKQLIDQKAEARLASKMLEQSGDRAMGYVERQAFENAIRPELLTGEPGGSYAQ